MKHLSCALVLCLCLGLFAGTARAKIDSSLHEASGIPYRVWKNWSDPVSQADENSSCLYYYRSSNPADGILMVMEMSLEDEFRPADNGEVIEMLQYFVSALEEESGSKYESRLATVNGCPAIRFSGPIAGLGAVGCVVYSRGSAVIFALLARDTDTAALNAMLEEVVDIDDPS